MNHKWIGAILVITACGYLGLNAAWSYRRRERLLGQLLHGVQMMQWELQYKLTPLPELARLAAKETGGALGDAFWFYARELDWMSSQDAYGCMKAALRRARDLPPQLRTILLRLGRILGRFDLEGQMQGLDSVQVSCKLALEELAREKDSKLRSFQTVGFCAGAFLAILLL